MIMTIVVLADRGRPAPRPHGWLAPRGAGSELGRGAVFNVSTHTFYNYSFITSCIVTNNACIHIYIYMYEYTYIYIYRERERERACLRNQ